MLLKHNKILHEFHCFITDQMYLKEQDHVAANTPAHPVHSNAIRFGDVFNIEGDGSYNVVTAVIHRRNICSFNGTWHRALTGYSEVYHT